MYTALMSVSGRRRRLRALGLHAFLAALIVSLASLGPSLLHAQNLYVIGTGTSSNGSSEYPAPYGKYYNGAKHQMLILASELTSAGASAGYMNSIAFNVAAVNSADAHPGFTIRLKQTTVTALSSTWDEVGWTTVYSVPSCTPVAGWNTYNFNIASEFQWDGVSNLMVEVCFNNYPYGYTDNASTYYTTTSFVSVNYFRSDSDALMCTPGRGSSGTSSNRPNMRFTFRQANDASLLDLASPVTGFTPGAQSVSVVLKNYGTNNLTSVQIPWSVNGTGQTTYNWTGSLAPGGSTVVQLGSYNFAANTSYTVSASISNPNNTTDANPQNNNLVKSVGAGLAGTVVVGAAPSDFTTLQAAASYLSDFGVRDHVVLNIKNGTYTGQLTLMPIPGTGPTRTVTIQSQSGNAADVVLNYSANSTDVVGNSLVRLDGADYVTLKNLTLTATGSYGILVRLLNAADNNTITNCVLNGKTTTSTSNNYAPIFANSSVTGVPNNNNTAIRNNTILNGSYGIYYYGSSTLDLAQGLQIKNNTFTSQYYMGIYLNQHDAPQIEENTFNVATTYSSHYALNMNACNNAFSVQKNKIGGSRATYGMYINNSTASPAARSLVANNFIQSGLAGNSSTVYGLYLVNVSGVNVYHNSVSASGTSTSSRALYISGGDIVAMNNIFAATGNGYAIYYAPPGLAASNNNVFYTAGTRIGYLSSDKTTLAAWQSASGFDAQSVVADPAFASATDLHTTSAAINGRGVSVPVTTDIDGATRSASAPDPGADEFSLSGVDAALQWGGPVAPAAAGNNSISLKVQNVRVTPISSLRLSYSDGTTTVTQDFTGLTIPPDGSQTLVFTTPYNLQSSVTLTGTIVQVNGAADADNTNNTAGMALRPALSGSYSVGGAGANFATIDDALAVLDAAGVSGPVTFNIASGTYNTQVLLKPFFGAGPANTVTLQAASGNAADVIIQPSSTTSLDKYTVRFAGNARHYILNKLTLMAPASGSYGWVVEMGNNVRNVAVRNSVVNALTYSSSSEFRGISVQATGHYQDNIAIENNTISGGYYSIYLYGFTDAPSNNIRIVNNTIQDFYFYGVYLYAVANSTITGNDITRPNRTTLSSYYGVTLNAFTRGVIIEKNRFHQPSPTTLSLTVYGVLATAADAPAGEENIVKNNLFYDLTTLGTLYTVYNSNSDGFFAYNNTIALDDAATASSSQSVGLLQVGPASNVRFRNNLVSITRGGSGLKIGVWLNDVTSQVESDNNLLYVNGAGGANYAGGFGGTVYGALSGYQAASSRDSRSVSANPLFLGATDYRIPYNSPAAKFNGMVLPAVTDDYTGALRSTLYADIGAYSSPASLHAAGSAVFGSIGKAQMRTFTVYNTSGSTPVAVSNLSFGGANAGNFRAYVAGTTTPLPSSLTLAPNGSLNVDVHFGLQGTSGIGAKSATFTFTNNGAQSPYTVSASGYYASLTAMDGTTNLLAPGAKFDVGGILVGGTPRTKDFRLAPDIAGLAAPLDITGYTLSGPDASLFAVSTIPASLNGQVIVSITLNSIGATPGTKTAVLTINHSGANGPATVIAVEGKVGKPILGVPTLIDLPFVVLGQTYSSPYDNLALIPLTRDGLVDVDMNQNPALTGNGAAFMEIVSNEGRFFLRGKFNPDGTIGIAGDGNIANSFNWASPSLTTPVKVTDTQPWFIVVRMKQPSSSTLLGSYSADMLLSNGTGKGASSAENAVTVVVIGKVISDPSKLSMYPTQIAFGTLPVGTRFSKTLTLRNQSEVAGTAVLTVTGKDFSFAGGQRSMAVELPADNSPVSVEVFFAPMSSGAANGVVSASGIITGTVALSGTGQAANPGNLMVLVDGQTPGSIVNFGTVAVGQSGSKTVTVINNNVGPVTISSIGRSGANATQFAVVDPQQWTVPGNGGSVSFMVKFVPTSVSNPQKDATVTIYNSTGVPKSLNVRGTAALSGGATVAVTLTPTQHNYGNQSGTQSFVLSNQGSSAITVSGALILGSSNFTVVDASSSFPRSVPAGGTTTITVLFNATQGVNGLRSGSLVVVTPGVSPYPTSSLTGRVGTASIGSSGGVQSQTALAGERVGVVESYPNPVEGVATVRYALSQPQHVSLRVYDELGREVLAVPAVLQTSGVQGVELDLSGIPAGRYYIRMEGSIDRAEGRLVKVK